MNRRPCASLKTRSRVLGFALIASAIMPLLPAAGDDHPAGQAMTMDEAVQAGLKSNLDVIAARYNVSLARADELSASLWSNPSLQLGASLQPFGSNWNQTSAGGPRQFDLGVSYPFDLSGKISSAKRSAEAGVSVSEAAFADFTRQKSTEIRLAYVEVLVDQLQITLSREKHETLENFEKAVERRTGGRGLLPLLEGRAHLARDQANLEVRQKNIALENAKSALSSVLGRSPSDASIEATTRLREFTLADIPDEQTLLRWAEELRPDFKGLKLAIAKAEADLELAHAQTWDNVTFNIGVTSQGPLGANPADPAGNTVPQAYSWAAGVALPLPVFNRNQGNVQKAATQREQAEAQLLALRQSARQEIHALATQLQGSRDLIAEYESRQLKLARQVRDAAQKQFGTGGSGLLEYFDAVGAYHSTLSSYYDAVGDHRRNLIRLAAAVGKESLS